ncbi:hypothetical protein LCGC14_2956140, partial [marine sediment metagenome]
MWEIIRADYHTDAVAGLLKD